MGGGGCRRGARPPVWLLEDILNEDARVDGAVAHQEEHCDERGDGVDVAGRDETEANAEGEGEGLAWLPWEGKEGWEGEGEVGRGGATDPAEAAERGKRTGQR